MACLHNGRIEAGVLESRYWQNEYALEGVRQRGVVLEDGKPVPLGLHNGVASGS